MGFVSGISNTVLFLPTTGFAIRDCDTDGVWKPNYDQNATTGWTNYTDCFKPDPALVGITVGYSRFCGCMLDQFTNFISLHYLAPLSYGHV